MGGQPRRRAERAAAGCPIGNGAVTSAVLVHLRVEPAHFDSRWRERPVLALLAWEACFAIRWRGYAASKWSQLGRHLILGQRLLPNRDIAASAHAAAADRAVRPAAAPSQRRGFRHQSSAGYRPAFPPIPTRSKAPLLSLAPRARSAPFVPLCPKVPDLLENQDRWLAFSDDFRALTLLGRQYHRSTAERSFIVP